MVLREVIGRYRIEIETGALCRFDQQPTNSPHSHPYCEVCLALSGRGKFHHGGRTYGIRPGDVFIADPEVVHEITSFESRDLELYFLSFSIHEVSVSSSPPPSQEESLIASFLGRHQIVSSDHSALNRYLPFLYESDQLSGIRLASARQAMKWFCLELMASLSEVPSDVSDDHNIPDEVRRAFEYLEANIGRRVSAAEIAGKLGMSERSLRRRFQESNGEGIAVQLLQRRMVIAMHRLLMGFTVRETGAHVGMEDPGQFSRAFRKVYGVPPRTFQANYRPGSLLRSTLPGQHDVPS